MAPHDIPHTSLQGIMPGDDVPVSTVRAWLSFAVYHLWFMMRDRVLPPVQVVREAGVEVGNQVLDYGCGSGSYALAAAQVVGPTGRVCAADSNPFAVRQVQRAAAAQGLTNVQVVYTRQQTGLADGSMDVVLLYNVLHALRDPRGVLQELHRVLKPGGLLSVRDQRMSSVAATQRVTSTGLFRLEGQHRRTLSFRPVGK